MRAARARIAAGAVPVAPWGRPAVQPALEGRGATGPMVARRRHWDSIYRTKREDEFSWHQDEPVESVRLLRGVTNRRNRIVDIGGGTSPLAGRLSEHGFHQITVVDIADAAVQLGPKRLGTGQLNVRWIRADVTRVDRLARFDVWHDREFFHFLTNATGRSAYVRPARRSVPVGGARHPRHLCSGWAGDLQRPRRRSVRWEEARVGVRERLPPPSRASGDPSDPVGGPPAVHVRRVPTDSNGRSRRPGPESIA